MGVVPHPNTESNPKPSSGLVFNRQNWPSFRPALTDAVELLGPELPEPEPCEPEPCERDLRLRACERDWELELPEPTLSALEPCVVVWWLAVLFDESVDAQPEVAATMMPVTTSARTKLRFL
jgi:hypothetical protein